MTGLGALALAPVLLIAGPAPQANLVLDCYVMQSSDIGLGQFVRHIEVRPARRLVVIADGIGGAPPRWVGNGRLLTLEADRLVYDFASSRSSGRTEIDRRTGAFRYEDGRSVIRGTCQQSNL